MSKVDNIILFRESWLLTNLVAYWLTPSLWGVVIGLNRRRLLKIGSFKQMVLEMKKRIMQTCRKWKDWKQKHEKDDGIGIKIKGWVSNFQGFVNGVFDKKVGKRDAWKMIQHQSGTEFEEAEEWEHMKTLNKTKEHADNVCAILRSSFHALPTHPVPTPIFFLP